MNCDQLNKFLPLYLSGELRGQELNDFETHVEGCKSCGNAVAADREQDDALRTAMLEETPDVSAVLERVHDRMTAPWWRRTPRPVFVRTGVLVAMILIVALISLPRLYMHHVQREMALQAVDDHYSDLVLLRHPDWESHPEDVARFLAKEFPQEQDLLRSITPRNSSFEKVRVCNLDGIAYAHFVFKTGREQASVFLRINPEGKSTYEAAHLSNGGHGLEVSGFSSSAMSGMVVGKQGAVATEKIAGQLASTL
ncbi:MAG TPA: zf-HC2 domain-containing protein [Candidatus Angelobacter sp.]|jgi:hypothetical protein